MQIEGDDGWVELRRREDDEAFDVRVSVGDFAGQNPRIWIDANDQRRFLDDVRRVDKQRKGEARLSSMSPHEFELIVRVVDRAGHVSVEGLLARLRYSGNRHDRLLLKFSFALDPTMLPKLVGEAVDLRGAV
jgi:hypothetical protein